MKAKTTLTLDYIANGLLIESIESDESDRTGTGVIMASAVKYIRNQTGMNKKQFADYLGIPYRTLQDWELGNARPPEYVVRLIAYKVLSEQEKNL